MAAKNHTQPAYVGVYQRPADGDYRTEAKLQSFGNRADIPLDKLKALDDKPAHKRPANGHKQHANGQRAYGGGYKASPPKAVTKAKAPKTPHLRLSQTDLHQRLRQLCQPRQRARPGLGPTLTGAEQSGRLQRL